MPEIIEGTLSEIIQQRPELSGKRVRLYVLEDGQPAQNLLEFLGDWVGSVHIPDSLQSTEQETVVEQAVSEKLLNRSQP
ncbi:MAG: hypothetical protein K6U12_00870 [Armatimonadetes bacterium]|nr:hypothetical protein [Armatimonadota bacterium]CUU37040.1 hypothetical protein DCOP10_119149 [Armatimonadetes bacterium DC]